MEIRIVIGKKQIISFTKAIGYIFLYIPLVYSFANTVCWVTTDKIIFDAPKVSLIMALLAIFISFVVFIPKLNKNKPS
jgi:ABC-type sulfate transport system permease component